MEIVECKVCGDEISRRNGESKQNFAQRRHCSRACTTEALAAIGRSRAKPMKPCDVCGDPVYSANAKPRLNRPRLYCGNDCRTKGLALKSDARRKNRIAISAATRSAGKSPEPGEYSESIPITVTARQVAKDVKHGRAGHEEPEEQRPATRVECKGGARPCPWVSCRYNLYLDVGAKGSLKLHFPHQDPTEVEYSCALDMADEDGVTLEVVGAATNVSRERVRQVEEMAIEKMVRGMKRTEKWKG